jgi:hypothetical protein
MIYITLYIFDLKESKVSSKYSDRSLRFMQAIADLKLIK